MKENNPHSEENMRFRAVFIQKLTDHLIENKILLAGTGLTPETRNMIQEDNAGLYKSFALMGMNTIKIAEATDQFAKLKIAERDHPAGREKK